MRKLLLLSITALLLSVNAFAQNGNGTLMGDVNNDGSVSVTDVTMVISHILGKTPDGFIKDAADVNGDGSITVTDVTMIINIILTKPEDTTPDYYVGWTNGTESDFANQSDSSIINGATGYSSSSNPTYTRAFGNNNIFYLLYQANNVPTITFISMGQRMTQNIIDDNTCPHSDVVIDGVTYKEFGIWLSAWSDPTDYITVVFSEPVITTPDYYVGWTNTATIADYDAMTATDVAALTLYEGHASQTYERAYGNDNTFFLLYKTNAIPTVTFISQNEPQSINLVNDNFWLDTYGNYKGDVTIDGTTFKVYSDRASSGYDTSDKMRVVFSEPVITTPDYYVGWTNGKKSDFAALSDADIINGATGYSISTTPTYTRTFGNNNIFYLLYQNAHAPQSIVFISNNTRMIQDIVNDNTCPHTDVVVDGVTYKEFGIRLTTGYDPNDSIELNF